MVEPRRRAVTGGFHKLRADRAGRHARNGGAVNAQASSGSCRTSSFPDIVTPPSIAMASPSA